MVSDVSDGTDVPGQLRVPRDPYCHKTNTSQESCLLHGKSFASNLGVYIHNECANVIHGSIDGDQSNVLRADRPAGAGVIPRSNLDVDLESPVVRRRLNSVCRLMQQLFTAFDRDRVISGRSIAGRSRCQRGAARLVNLDAFGGLFGMLTLWALFGPDALLVEGNSAAHTLWIAILNTVVFLLFLSEGILNCFAIEGYTRSLRMLVDFVATLSMVGDTLIGSEIIPTDAAAAGRGTRFSRLMKLGGRSSRLLRLARTARILQVLRFVPRVVRMMDRGRRDLAVILVHKRLWRIFQFLDEAQAGTLTQYDMDLFGMAMEMEFPIQAPLGWRSYVETLGESLGREGGGSGPGDRRSWLDSTILVLLRIRRFIKTRGRTRVRRTEYGTYRSIVEHVLRRPTGQVAIARCEEDLQCIKDSCTMLQRASAQMALKICTVVLAMVVISTMLEVDVEDRGDVQALTHLTAALATGPCEVCQSASSTALAGDALACALVRQFAENCRHGLVFLAVDGVVQWSAGCQGDERRHPADVLAAADSAAQRTGLQPHELMLHCAGEDVCHSGARTMALLDTQRWVRDEAKWSLAYTSIVLVLIIVFVLLFAQELNKLGTHILYPLWDLLDDMCALKSFEVVCMGDIAPAQEIVRHMRRSRPLKSSGPRLWLLRGSDCVARLCTRATFEDANELKELRISFGKMHAALRSWTKFVPPLLCMQLFCAGVEATIAVQKCWVTIFFCDLEGFRSRCANLRPEEALALLNKLQHGICDVIENNDGTLLEFIEDEILAVFNAPSQVLCHEEKAVRAAVEAQAHVAETLPTVRLRAGVHTAQVLVGNIGSPSRMKYGVLGDGVNATARLKSLNSRYGTSCLVSDRTLGCLMAPHDEYLLRPVGNLVLKGRTASTKTWEVLGMRKCGTADLVACAEKSTKAYELFLGRHFEEARALFREAGACRGVASGDAVSEHFVQLCEQYLAEPPADDWDGVEYLTAK